MYFCRDGDIHLSTGVMTVVIGGGLSNGGMGSCSHDGCGLCQNLEIETELTKTAK